MTTNNSFMRTVAFLVALVLIAACGRNAEQPDEQAGGGTEAAQEQKGPHGGKLLREGDFAVEVKIYEEGVPPEFRLYAYDDEKPVDVSELKATIDVKRLDRTDVVRFMPKGDYAIRIAPE